MIRFENVTKRYKAKQVLKEINLTIEKACHNYWRKWLWENYFIKNDK